MSTLIIVTRISLEFQIPTISGCLIDDDGKTWSAKDITYGIQGLDAFLRYWTWYRYCLTFRTPHKGPLVIPVYINNILPKWIPVFASFTRMTMGET